MKKKRILLVALLGTAVITMASVYKAKACTGDWVPVYNGGSTVAWQSCQSTWFTSNCVCGDTRTGG